MKLTELEPVWIHPDIFLFKNPTGGDDWLTCKRVVMSLSDQHNLITDKMKYSPRHVVPCKAEYSWKFEGNDFNTMTVTPSLDASASGNWHGFITNGEIK